MKNAKTASVAYIGMFTALIAVSAWISIPLPVPVTLQIFAVCLCGALLGTKRALAATAAYILLGVVGAPVFSGFQGGISVILSPAGGYIIGFLLIALVTGLFSEKAKGRMRLVLTGMALGTLLCYAFGTLWYALFFPSSEGISFASALMICVVPFILPDVLKIFAAALLSKRLGHLFKK